jgi:hypothetical protein
VREPEHDHRRSREWGCTVQVRTLGRSEAWGRSTDAGVSEERARALGQHAGAGARHRVRGEAMRVRRGEAKHGVRPKRVC